MNKMDGRNSELRQLFEAAGMQHAVRGCGCGDCSCDFELWDWGRAPAGESIKHFRHSGPLIMPNALLYDGSDALPNDNALLYDNA